MAPDTFANELGLLCDRVRAFCALDREIGGYIIHKSVQPFASPELEGDERLMTSGGVRMSRLKGTRTEKNLLAAFAGESQARNRYTYFASQARKEGYEQIAFVFEETANQEKEHAKRFFAMLEGGDVEITAAYPAGKIGNTLENLRAAAAGEMYEWGSMYPDFAQTARDEGFEAIARLFENVAVAEKYHERRYNALAQNLESGRVFKREQPVVWRCRNCGFTYEGTEAPAACPACAHPQAYFELLVENW